MKSDIQIARETPLKRIKDVAESMGIPRDEVISFGRHMAKYLDLIDNNKIEKSNLILVTAITATKAGIGNHSIYCLALGLIRLVRKLL